LRQKELSVVSSLCSPSLALCLLNLLNKGLCCYLFEIQNTDLSGRTVAYSKNRTTNELRT
jgi:hypothetical protein